MLHLMMQVSPSTLRSRTMRWNSALGIVTVHLYSVSGMPRFSLSMSMSLSSKSETRSPSVLSKQNLTVSPSSSARIVIWSSLPAHLSTLLMDTRFIPSEMLRSHRYLRRQRGGGARTRGRAQAGESAGESGARACARACVRAPARPLTR